MLAAMRELARETGAWLLVGSLVIDIGARARRTPRRERRLANRSFLIDADGRIVARYDKIHMFDIDLAGRRELSRKQRLSGRASAPSFGRDAVGPARHDASATMCGSRISTARWRMPAPIFWRSRRSLRCRPARRIGMCCCGRGRSRTAALCSPRRNGASMPSGAQELWPFADRRSVGRGAGRRRRGGRDHQRADRPGAHRRGAGHGAVTRPRPALYADRRLAARPLAAE